MTERNKLIDEGNPWKTLSSRIVYRNKWMELQEDTVITPSGSEGIYAHLSKRRAVGAVILNEKNEVYLVGQYRYPMKEYSWELVEGGVEEGEDLLTAIKREMKEEAGIEAKKFDLLHKNLHISNGFTAEVGAMFLVRGIQEGEAAPEPTEKIKLTKIPFDDAIRYVYQGKIKDIYSIAGLFLAKEFLDKENKFC